VRWVPLATEAQRAAACACAQLVVTGRDAHMGAPDACDLKRNLRRLDYALEKFGFTQAPSAAPQGTGCGTSACKTLYEGITGEPSPVRGGGSGDRRTRPCGPAGGVSLAGHARLFRFVRGYAQKARCAHVRRERGRA
jgi:hypothetical protein